MNRIYYLIHQFLTGRSEKEELNELRQEMERTKEISQEVHKLSSIWLVSGLHENMKPAIPFDETWQKIEQKEEKSVRRRMPVWVKYAAIVIFTLNAGWWSAMYFNKQSPANNNIQIVANNENNSQITLPDQSVVFLRPGSTLNYDANFQQGNRKVFLSGEAYFEVTKDPHNPFSVVGKGATVEVLGTKFNFLSDETNGRYETTLLEGKVNFITASGGHYTLEPNQNITYDAATNTTNTKTVDVSVYTAWKEGKVVFRDEKLPDIIEQLEQMYQVRFVVRNRKILEEYRFNGTFHRQTPVGDVLKMLQLSIPMKVSREEHFPETDIIYID